MDWNRAGDWDIIRVYLRLDPMGRFLKFQFLVTY